MFEELDDETRKWMLIEFEAEESSKPYRPRTLDTTGLAKFADIMRNAIRTGDIQSLEYDLSTYIVSSPANAAHRLAHTEFTTWYTRGFARRLREEGIDECEVYRAGTARQPRCDCSRLEGVVVSVNAIYDGHRVPYHHNGRKTSNYTGSPIPIPKGPMCHHTIRRKRSK